MTNTNNSLLAVLSPAEQDALYGLPDFDDAQCLDFLSLTEEELSLVCSRTGLHYQAWCILQIGYFKAKHTFFRFVWEDVPDDLAFVRSRYFPEQVVDAPPGFHTRTLCAACVDCQAVRLSPVVQRFS